MKTSIADKFFHNHFKNILLALKMFLIPITIVYFVIAIILSSNKKEKEEHTNLQKGFQIFNNILFYIIIVFIILTSSVLLYVTRKSSLNVFYESINTFRHKKQENKKIAIPVEVLNYYLSVIWWMILYLVVVTIFVTIAKIKHDPKLIYNLF